MPLLLHLASYRFQVRLQVRPDIYHGTADAIKKTASEGLSAFYKGTVSPLIGVGACVSIQFGVLEGMKRSWKVNGFTSACTMVSRH